MPTRMSKIETAPRLVLEFNAALNRRDVAGMLRLLAGDCVLESPDPAPDGTVYAGKDAVAGYWRDRFAASPQAHVKIEEIAGFGIRCIARWRYDWVDTDGNSRYIRGVDIFYVKDKVISKIQSYVKGML